jgi:hypothetical protein
MSFAKRPRPLGGAPTRVRAAPAHARAHTRTVVRAALLAAFVIIAAAWAFARHYSFKPPPMLVPVPPTAAPTYDIDADELPVPETLEPDAN